MSDRDNIDRLVRVLVLMGYSVEQINDMNLDDAISLVELDTELGWTGTGASGDKEQGMWGEETTQD